MQERFISLCLIWKPKLTFLHGFHSFDFIFYSHTKSFDQSGVWCCNRVTDLTKFLIVKCHAIALSCETIKAQFSLRLDTLTIHFQIWSNHQKLLGAFDWQITMASNNLLISIINPFWFIARFWIELEYIFWNIFCFVKQPKHLRYVYSIYFFLHATRKPIKSANIFCMTIKIRRWNLLANKLWILTSCCGCQWGIPPTRTICIEALFRCWICTDGRLWMTCKICSIIW